MYLIIVQNTSLAHITSENHRPKRIIKQNLIERVRFKAYGSLSWLKYIGRRGEASCWVWFIFPQHEYGIVFIMSMTHIPTTPNQKFQFSLRHSCTGGQFMQPAASGTIAALNSLQPLFLGLKSKLKWSTRKISIPWQGQTILILRSFHLDEEPF